MEQMRVSYHRCERLAAELDLSYKALAVRHLQMLCGSHAALKSMVQRRW